MSVIKMTHQQIGPELRARAKKTPGVLQKAMKRSAMQARTLLARRTPKDLGQAKAGWKVSQFVKGTKGGRVDVYNDVPYVAILELGARPHSVSLEGRIAIYEWVVRHYGQFRARHEGGRAKRRSSEQREREYMDITNAIVQKIRKKGQDPTYFVKSSIDQLSKDFGKELDKQIAAYSKRRAKKGIKT